MLMRNLQLESNRVLLCCCMPAHLFQALHNRYRVVKYNIYIFIYHLLFVQQFLLSDYYSKTEKQTNKQTILFLVYFREKGIENKHILGLCLFNTQTLPFAHMQNKNKDKQSKPKRTNEKKKQKTKNKKKKNIITHSLFHE